MSIALQKLRRLCTFSYSWLRILAFYGLWFKKYTT